MLVSLGGPLAILAGGVLLLRAGGSSLPGESPSTRPPAVQQSATEADSIRLAAAARTRCRALRDSARHDCYAEVLLGLVRQDRIRLAMGVLGRLQAADPIVRQRGHDLSHVVGINAWRPGKDLGAVYGQCTELFQSGCYHGVIQAWFAFHGTDSATVSGVCDAAPEIRDSPWLRFQCVHGVGHGLVQAFRLDLPRALGGCDQLRGSFDQHSCYGGAFMEFVLGSRGQSHHPSLRPESHEHHAPADSAPAFRFRDPADPLYPCTAVGEKYQMACYELQPSIIFETTRGDLAGMARACDRAPEALRPSCYQGIGTFISGLTVRNAKESIRICSLGSARYRQWCFVGVVKNFIDVTSRADDGIDYCRLLGDHALKTRCYVAVGEQVNILHVAAGDREAACLKAEPGYVEACRYGARLGGMRPPALPEP